MKDVFKKFINDENPTEKNILIIFVILLALFLMSFLIIFSMIYTFAPDIFNMLIGSISPNANMIEKMNNSFLYLLVILIISTFIEFIRKKISSRKRLTDSSYEIILSYLVLELSLYILLFYLKYKFNI